MVKLKNELIDDRNILIREIRVALSKYDNASFDSALIYVDKNNNQFVLSDEDDILNKLEENEESVVFCMVSNRLSRIFADTNSSRIYTFYHEFRFWDTELYCYECESFEDAYRTFFPIHETEERCYSKRLNKINE